MKLRRSPDAGRAARNRLASTNRSRGDLLTNVVLYWLSRLMARRKKQVVFGAWQGTQYSDNSRYLFEYLAEHAPDLELIWCGDEQVRAAVPTHHPNVSFVSRGSARGYWACLRAGAAFVSHGYRDLAPYNVLNGSALFYLGHGIAIKNMGSREVDADSGLRSLARKLWRRPAYLDHWIASSEAHADKLLRENSRALVAPELIARTGQPRLDLLVDSATDPSLRQRVRQHMSQRYGLPADAVLITYLPTFRDSGSPNFSFAEAATNDAEQIASLLNEHGAWIAEKNHGAAPSFAAESSGRLLNVSGDPHLDTQRLLLASDVLITDYSGCYIDFLLVDRPILHFAYDLDEYLHRDRGLYFSLDDYAGGDVVEDLDGLLEAIARSVSTPEHGSEQRELLRERLVTWESGTSRKAVAQLLYRATHH